MRVPVSWLKEYVDIVLPLPELAERMTLAGLEVAAIEQIGAEWDRDKIVVGEVVEVRPHPNADRLTIAVVDHGAGEPEAVVTGATNLKVGDHGQKVAFARSGARLIDGYAQEKRYITLKPAKIRGVVSAGMVCSEKELGLSDEHEGILILDPDAPVGMPLQDYLGDAVLDIDLTPNLGRCLSVIGIAREVAALTGQELRVTEPTMKAEGAPIEGQIEIEIADPDLCSRYTATLIRGVKVGPSPLWMQRRLRMAGMRPINCIVDITNYVMLEWGQPLHAFDYDKL
ncbi:MAG: phenylalanine--tRNA ligase subunit beta, partial [Chloroflexi bacterium]|nr:phenylalanine--tRNA ligase subunit beta [Chloroflexota bacterium]